MRIHWPKLLSVACLALLVASCSQNGIITNLGYTVGQRYSDSIKTVSVPIFKNRTTIRDIEYELTQAVVQRIHKVTPWKVVQHNADAELSGAVVLVQKRDFLQNPLNEVRVADLTVTAEVLFHDCRTGRNLMRPGEDIPLNGPQVDPLAAPTPVAIAKPVLVQWSATFTPEVGESYASGRARVIQELAVQIVNMMEAPW